MGLFDDPASFLKTPEGIGALSALAGYAATAQRNTPINNLGRAGMAGLLGYSNAQNQQLNQEYKGLQEQLMKAQITQMQRKQAMIEQLTGSGEPPSSGAAYAALAAGAKTGDFGPTVTNAARIQPTGTTLPANRFGNVDPQAAAYELAFNDGKELPKWMYEQSKPQVNASADGQVTITARDPKTGAFKTSIPEGSLEAYGQFKNLSQPLNVKTSSGQEIQLAPQEWADYQKTGVLPMRFIPAADRAAVMKASGGNPANVSYRLPSGDMAGGSIGTIGLSQSPQEAAAQEASKVYWVESAKDMADRMKTIVNGEFKAPGNIAKYNRIGDLLGNFDGSKYSQTGVEVAKGLKSLGIDIDPKLGNKEAAARIANEMALSLRDTSSGGGMPGAMSDADREYLKSMVPSYSNSADGRQQMIRDAVAIEQRNQQVAKMARQYVKQTGRLDNGFFDQLSEWSNQNPLFKDAKPIAASSGGFKIIGVR